MPSIEWNRKTFAKEVQSFADKASNYGDRWGDPEKSTKLIAIRKRFIEPYLDVDKVALEVGSGGGRFTQYLLPFKKIYCVDINAEMFDYLRRRFPQVKNLEFVHSSGSDIPGVPNGSIDFVWSFGTFVHIEVPELRGYLEAFKPLLRPNARLTIHYTDKTKPEAMRQAVLAQMTRSRMHDLLATHGYRILEEDVEQMIHSNVVAFVKI